MGIRKEIREGKDMKESEQIYANLNMKKTGENIRSRRERLGMNRPDIPVYLGEELPLVRPYVDAMDTHGEDGLGESHYPEITDGTINTDGVGFLARTLHEAAQKEEPVSIMLPGTSDKPGQTGSK